MKSKLLFLAAALVVALVGIGAAAPGQASAPPPRSAATEEPSTTAIAQCADPSIYLTSTHRYMFCTGGKVYTSGASAQDWPNPPTVALSKDTFAPRACGSLWTPVILKRAASYGDEYVMLYSSNWKNDAGVCQNGNDGTDARRCVYAATASTPAGPYHNPTGQSAAVVCDSKDTYAPQWFRGDGGAPYIVARRNGFPFAFHKMTTDLLSLAPDADWQDTGIQRDRAWEQANGGPIEGPAFLRLPSDYWVLFYTAGNWHTDTYAEGYAVCGNGNVPSTCTKPAGNKLVSAADQSFGLGAGMGFLDSAGRPSLVVAGYYGTHDCTTQCSTDKDARPRYARIFRLTNIGGTPPTNLAVATPPVQ